MREFPGLAHSKCSRIITVKSQQTLPDSFPKAGALRGTDRQLTGPCSPGTQGLPRPQQGNKRAPAHHLQSWSSALPRAGDLIQVLDFLQGVP